MLLGRLPVTSSLLRFKSVCKSWRALIQNPFLVDRQTTTTTTPSFSNKFGSFILQTIEPSVNNYKHDIKMYMLSSGSGNGNGGSEDDGDDDQKKMVVDDLGFWQFYNDFLLREGLGMVGSCNGIICLHDSMAMDQRRGITRQHYSHLRDVSLWNPATRQFRILPKSIPIEEREYEGTDFVTFSFDVKTKDYRVLRITPFRPSGDGGCMCRVQVYSLSTDSWRLLEGIHYLPIIPNQPGIYLNGSYFFVGAKYTCTNGSRVEDFMLLTFDFTKEIFTTMQLPDENSRSVLISCLGEKLVVFTKITPPMHAYDAGYEYYNIWVLNEQKDIGSIVVNKDSWTKLHSIGVKTRRGQYSCSEPRCISNNGEFALISPDDGDDGNGRNKLQLFDIITKEAKEDFTIGSRGTRLCRVDVYEESQVSIMGENVLLRWQLPTHGACYKLNLDAPFIAYDFFGIGLCLTSDTGGCIGVRSLKRWVRDAKEGEALAMLEAIKWAKKLELSHVIIESDSKNCVSFFMDDNNNSTYWSSGELSLLWEAKFLLNSSEIGISFQYRSRSCNYVADIAAYLGRQGFWSCKDWTANFPGEIVMSLSKDLGLET